VTGNACGCDLIMPGRPDQNAAKKQAYEEGKLSMEDLRRSALRVLRLIRKNTALPVKA